MQRRAFSWQSSAAPAEAPDPVEDDPEAVRQLEIPALVAVGERDVPGFADAALRLAEALPLARHVVLAGAGHLAPLETPLAFRALLLEFLPAALGGRV
jgi:pimeloyl-ACP methyl ester carboxylesterase